MGVQTYFLFLCFDIVKGYTNNSCFLNHERNILFCFNETFCIAEIRFACSWTVLPFVIEGIAFYYKFNVGHGFSILSFFLHLSLTLSGTDSGRDKKLEQGCPSQTF
jgi:hypothetical protein